MKGIDIASYQQNTDFQKVKNSGIEIVYIKATEGLTYNNPLLESQYNGAKAVGLKIGFFHYLRANDPLSEANHFLSAIKGLSADCKYAVDVEMLSGATVAEINTNLRLFANNLISNGKEVCVYTNDSFYSDILNSSVKDIPLWVAHYGVAKPDAINYIGFQYSSTGNVPGINGSVDLDDFNSGIFITSISPIINMVVQTFQHATNLVGLKDNNGNNLVEDGILGPRTTEVIAKVFVTIGAHNELVRWIQQRLIALGFNCGKTGADSFFGVNTLAAVLSFQTSRVLKSDGIVGPLTTKQLL